MTMMKVELGSRVTAKWSKYLDTPSRAAVHPADFIRTTIQQLLGKFFVTKMWNKVREFHRLDAFDRRRRQTARRRSVDIATRQCLPAAGDGRVTSV